MSSTSATSQFFMQVRDLFERVADMPALERDAVLERGDWPMEVVREVQDLLAVEPDERFEESRLGDVAEQLVDSGAVKRIEAPIGPYRILRRLGEGGMGVVYLARQEHPVERIVALKVVRAGLACRTVLQRFERERRVLALMDHPGIARVLDAGTTEEGLPYFAMEYIEGEPIHSYCDRAGASLHERVRLIARACEAVHHAHQKGVLHRDLKPNNILVEETPAEPRLKVIDFGLARALEQDLDDGSVRTIEGTFLGTPEYMSPEQARGDLAKVGVLSDVYSLGVVLYQLVTGMLPIELGSWSDGGFEALRERISKEEPQLPSRRLMAQSSASHKGTAQTRFSTRARLRELDWVVMRALEKDPARRYDSVRALGVDLILFLGGQPLMAGPPGFRYRIEKFVRRHRVSVTIVLLLLTSAVVGGGFSLSYALEAEAEQARSARVLSEFEMIASVVELEDAQRAMKELKPAWPDKIAAIDDWLATHGRRVPVLRDRVEQTLSELELRALPWSDVDRSEDRRNHPQVRELEEKSALLDHLRRGRAIRDGLIEVEEPALIPEEIALAPRQLEEMARARLLGAPIAGERIIGDEARALSLAREAFERMPFLTTARTYAWALHANGHDEEALEFFDEFVERERGPIEAFLDGLRSAPRTPDLQRRQASVLQVQYEMGRTQRWLEDTVAAWSDGTRDHEIDALQAEVQAMQEEVSKRLTWEFANPAELILRRTLVEARDRLGEFRARVLPEIERDRFWANGIEAWTLNHPRATVTWDDAREAVAKADDVVASRAYAEQPIILRPQLGLVPIGMNPVTKLWEFYHLRSAWDPESDLAPSELSIPHHDERGDVPTEGGIVFVLAPGGGFLMGMPQDSGTRFGNLDELREHPVRLDPFFFARHEITRAQWRRLGDRVDPSFYRVGDEYNGIPDVIGMQHPVDSVSWDQFSAVLEEHGLRLPTEAQWEYAARAGTSTPWFTGNSAESLNGFANLLDRTAETLYPDWGMAGVDWEDGFAGPAPVGSFLPNPWGLFDIYGNTSEYCACGFVPYAVPPAYGDGHRTPRDEERVFRGESFSSPPDVARSGWRNHRRREERAPDLGARAARALR